MNKIFVDNDLVILLKTELLQAKEGLLTSASNIAEYTTAFNDIQTRRIRKIERAIDKCEEGTYGFCEICGQPITTDRLKKYPESITCLACQSIIEKKRIT